MSLNIVEYMLTKYNNKNWNYGDIMFSLSSHKELTIDIVKKLINRNWNWSQLSRNLSVATFNAIRDNPYLPWDWVDIARNSPHAFRLFNLFTDRFNLHNLSMNPVLYINFVKRFSDKMYWRSVSKNSGITVEDIDQNPHLPWHWGDFGVSYNPNLTIDFLKKYYQQGKPFSWQTISMCENISFNDIERTLDILPWNFKRLSRRNDLPMEFLEAHIDESWEWGAFGLSCNSAVTLEIIEKYMDKPWHWFSLSYNINLTGKFVEYNLYKPWSWNNYMSGNVGLGSEFFKKYLIRIMIDKGWDWYKLSRNSSVSLDTIDENSFIVHWSWNIICCRGDLTIEFVRKHLDKKLDWFCLSRNRCFNMETIMSNPDLPWSWEGISCNPNITVDFIESHIDNIKFPFLSLNFVSLRRSKRKLYIDGCEGGIKKKVIQLSL